MNKIATLKAALFDKRTADSSPMPPLLKKDDGVQRPESRHYCADDIVSDFDCGVLLLYPTQPLPR